MGLKIHLGSLWSQGLRGISDVSDTSYEYHMNNSEVVWFCPTCDLLNIALPDVSLTDSESDNPFHVLSDLKDEAEFDINVTVGTSPAKTSSPKSRTRKTCRQKDIENQNRSRPGETDREKDQNPRGPPQKKQGNVPVVKVFIANFQSIKNKSADFAAFDETERPDVILGCESWLHGNIASAENFPSHFQVTRNDRNTNGGGVFVATKDTIPRLERPDLSTGNSEITWCQLLIDNTSFFFFFWIVLQTADRDYGLQKFE